MLDENGDDPYYSRPLPFMNGFLGTFEERGERPNGTLLEEVEPETDLLKVHAGASVGVSEALAK